MTPHGDAIKFRRQALKMSLATVAAASGISKSHLSRVERGLAGLGARNIHRLAQALYVPPTAITHRRETT